MKWKNFNGHYRDREHIQVIPVLDYSVFLKGGANDFVSRLGKSCRETGFFVLSNHGIDSELIEGAFEGSKSFFAQDPALKNRLDIANSTHNRGYAGQGSEALDETSGIKDSKEAFNIGLDLGADDPRVVAGEPFRGVNQWPDQEGFREIMLSYFDAMWALGVGLHRAIARDLGLREEWFVPHFTEPMATLRLLHYPAAQDETDGVGAGAHTDYGSLTLLVTDGTAGLQIRPRGGDWIDAPQIDNTIIVNIGDCLMRWTNDIYVSTPHRVFRPKQERYSIAFFLDPNPDSVISAIPGTGEAKYPPMLAADYLAGRLAATYSLETPE